MTMATAEDVMAAQDSRQIIGDEPRPDTVDTTTDEAVDVTVGGDSSKIEIEVVDDRPPEDRRDVDPKVKEEDTKELTEEEIAQLGKRAQDRIRRLKWEYHEERRQKEAAQRMADEAVAHTKRLVQERQRTHGLLTETQKVLTETATKRADAAIKAAEDQLRMAHESGDPSAITSATRALHQAELAKTYAPAMAKQVAQRWFDQNPDKDDDAEPKGADAAPATPTIDAKAEAWKNANSWFGSDTEMTSLAYGIHEKLVREGVDTSSDEYYSRIDRRMREVFPDRFEDDSGDDDVVAKPSSQATGTRPNSPTVVASATRNNGASKPRTVSLTATQVRIAKRLGLTLEEYATELLKEQGSV